MSRNMAGPGLVAGEVAVDALPYFDQGYEAPGVREAVSVMRLGGAGRGGEWIVARCLTCLLVCPSRPRRWWKKRHGVTGPPRTT